MRWIMFFILLYLMTALQSAKFAAFPTDSQWPEILYLPLLTIFYALFADAAAVPFVAILCGLMLDLTTPVLVGTNIIPLALVGWMILRIRLSIFREHAFARAIMTFFGILAYALLSLIFRKLISAPIQSNPEIEAGSWRFLRDLSADALYTAALAPAFFWLFFRFRQMLGFSTQGVRGRMR